MSGMHRGYPGHYGEIYLGDCLEIMKLLDENSVDALVCDPPAGVSFMNKEFDSDRGGRIQWVAWLGLRLAEAYRLMKPGAHGLIWALPRTSHWTALAIEQAGFEIRDCVYHIFGAGFPKSHNISKAIDKLAGAERKVIEIQRVKDIRRNVQTDRELGWATGEGKFGPGAPSTYMEYARTEAATDEAKQWEGWGTALKPAVECWWLVRKPISEKSIAENVLKWGTGALNIDACRIPTAEKWSRDIKCDLRGGNYGSGNGKKIFLPSENHQSGRWPADLMLSHSIWCQPVGVKRIKGNGSHYRHDGTMGYGGAIQPFETLGHGDSDGMEEVEIWNCHESCPIAAINAQGPGSKGHPYTTKPGHQKFKGNYNNGKIYTETEPHPGGYADEGGSARYFQCFDPDPFPFIYAGKAPRSERNLGLEELPEKFSATMNDGIGAREHNPDEPNAWNSNHHPTVKSQALMRYLCRMVGIPGGTILDCFSGSGSTLIAAIAEGFRYLGMEMEEDYFEIAQARIQYAEENCNFS